MEDDINIDPVHFSRFVQSVAGSDKQGRVGRNVRNWATAVMGAGPEVSELPNGAVDRADLYRICHDSGFSEIACFCAIMAWGGMRIGHAREAVEHRRVWEPTLIKIRNDAALSRSEVFHLLNEHRIRGFFPGVRAAFFTKLIFFMQPTATGYIMDQWTSRSVNLLCGRKIVCLNSRGYVSDDNTAEHYGAFCQSIETIAMNWPTLTKPSPAKIEEWMMSVGGKRLGDWRLYLRSLSR